MSEMKHSPYIATINRDFIDFQDFKSNCIDIVGQRKYFDNESELLESVTFENLVLILKRLKDTTG